MKAYFVCYTYWPNKDGVQMVTQYLAEGLATLGHDVTVVTTRQQAQPRLEAHNGVSIQRFQMTKKLKVPVGEKVEFQKFLLENLSAGDALITVCSPSGFSAWTFEIVDKLPCKKILYQHGMYDGRLHLDRVHSAVRLAKLLLLTPYSEQYHKRHWKQIMQYDACIHLFENDSSYSYFERHGFHKNYVINNSCEEAVFLEQHDESIPAKYGIEKRYFLYVGNYCAAKNQMKAVRLFAQAACPDTDLVLIGSTENDYAKSVRALIETQKATEGKVHLLTGISREDTVELIKNSYACLLTSENEYLPITIIESLAAGKPYISTNVGVVPQLPGGVVGHNDEELTYWMRYFASHEDYVQQLGEIGHTYAVENCMPRDKVRKLEKIILKV
ncbi:MAG: glycosyltransferase family 4 protein [Ruminococcaceae bacterium]|nr:glycosyltransferase family 4 protein [Oscillospiraceae bacterium]